MKIIPYQELLGNYDTAPPHALSGAIIPYQELLGNYDNSTRAPPTVEIIPYQELLGNYDKDASGHCRFLDYTIPRAIREL